MARPNNKGSNFKRSHRKTHGSYDRRLNPRNGRPLHPHERVAALAREDGTRSRYQRCPRCKHLRLKWMLDNNWHEGRRRWQYYQKQLVCHICVERLEAEGEKMDENSKPKPPTVGDTIYVDSAFYLSHGSDDVVGGKATVTKVSKDHGTVFVEVQEHPGHAYNWELLAEKQAALKKEFGLKKARTDPDEDRPWIEEGDDVGGKPYHGPDVW